MQGGDRVAAQVRRASLEKWLNEPFFEEAVVGAVARVAVRGSYMMAEVLQVIEREPGVYKCATLGFDNPALHCMSFVLPLKTRWIVSVVWR